MNIYLWFDIILLFKLGMHHAEHLTTHAQQYPTNDNRVQTTCTRPVQLARKQLFWACGQQPFKNLSEEKL